MADWKVHPPLVFHRLEVILQLPQEISFTLAGSYYGFYQGTDEEHILKSP